MEFCESEYRRLNAANSNPQPICRFSLSYRSVQLQGEAAHVSGQAGQNCIGIELILVPRPKYQLLIDLLVPRVKALRSGTDVGSLFSSAPISKLEDILTSASSQGAQVLAGGKSFEHPDHPGASYFQPTLVGEVKMDMDIARTELFAPVMSVVPYDTVDQAVEWLNKSRFGLGAGVYGNDKAECRRVAGLLECGMVSVNEYISYRLIFNHDITDMFTAL